VLLKTPSSTSSSTAFAEIDLNTTRLNTTRQNDQSVSKVFLDNGGRHAIIALRSTTGFSAETLYTHARSRRKRGRLQS
jgi:hypothetical protein